MESKGDACRKVSKIKAIRIKRILRSLQTPFLNAKNLLYRRAEECFSEDEKAEGDGQEKQKALFSQRKHEKSDSRRLIEHKESKSPLIEHCSPSVTAASSENGDSESEKTNNCTTSKAGRIRKGFGAKPAKAGFEMSRNLSSLFDETHSRRNGSENMRQWKISSGSKIIERIQMNDALLIEAKEQAIQNPNRSLDIQEKEEISGRRSEKAKENSDFRKSEKKAETCKAQEQIEDYFRCLNKILRGYRLHYFEQTRRAQK